MADYYWKLQKYAGRNTRYRCPNCGKGRQYTRFINAVGEYSEEGTAIREVCKEFKRLMNSYMKGLAEQAGIKEADELASELALLLEGSIVTAQVSEQREKAAKTAKRVAKALIDEAKENKRN